MFEKKSRKFKADYIVGLAIVLVGGGSISSGISLNSDADVALFVGGLFLVILGLLAASYKGKF